MVLTETNQELNVNVVCLFVNVVFVDVLFESTLISNETIMENADTTFTSTLETERASMESATPIIPVEGITGIPKLMSSGVPSDPSSTFIRVSNTLLVSFIRVPNTLLVSFIRVTNILLVVRDVSLTGLN